MSPHRTHHRIRHLLALCASAVLLSIPRPSDAVQRFWNNPAVGDFTVGTNWQGGVAPGTADDAYFGVGDLSPTVTFPVNVSTDQLTILQHDVTFDLQGHTYALTSALTDTTNASFKVGNNVGDNGILHILNGTLTANYTYIGWVGGSDDNMFVSTGGIFNATTINIAHAGLGHLRVENGGIVNSTNALLGTLGVVAQGFVTVNGAGSQWTNSATMNIGNGRPGFVTVENSGTVTTDTAVVAGASSILTVTGATSAFHSRNITIIGGTLNHTGGNIQASSGGSVPATGIYVGLGGGGMLDVNSGGHLNTTGIASIGHFLTGNGVANLSNATTNWTHTGELNVGVAGVAQFNIGAGATASNSGNAYIARGAGSVGNLTINGVNSRWDIANDLFVAQGTSQLNIIGGGTLTTNNAFIAPAAPADSHMFVNGAGSLWRTAHSVEIAGSGGPGGPATLNVGTAAPGGTVLADDSIKVWPLGRINQNSGEIRTPLLTIQGGTVTNSNGILNLDPASSPFATNGVYIGVNGNGNLNITAGGKLTTNHEAYIGVYSPSVGDVTLDGAGSNWTINSPVVIGDAGKGILTIDNGASASSITETRIGFAVGSTGSVTVDGASAADPSSFTTTGFIDVATFGLGFLSITNQAFVSSGDAVVGRNAGSKGTVKITDNLAEWRCTNLYIGGDNVGPGGTGLVNIANNGVLTVTGPITVWPAGTLQSYPVSIATTELRLRGGKFSAWSNFNAPISNGGGTIEVPGSNILFLNNSLTSLPGSLLTRIGTGDLYIIGPQNHAPNSTFQVTGGQTYLRSNAGTPASLFFPATANLNVTVGPGGAKIILLTDQIFHQLNVNTANAGRQAFDLNSPAAPGAFSAVSIYDTSLKTPLWAAIANANRAGAPDPQDGIFDSHLSSHPASGIGLAKLSDAHGDSYVQIRPTRIGDLNLDGIVTISDFIDLAANFNVSGPNITWQEGDLNYDNAVTISDFIDLSANFGAAYTGAASPVSAVPEPATLLALAAVLLLSPRRRTLH